MIGGAILFILGKRKPLKSVRTTKLACLKITKKCVANKCGTNKKGNRQGSIIQKRKL
jgi:hypothetical protein